MSHASARTLPPGSVFYLLQRHITTKVCRLPLFPKSQTISHSLGPEHHSTSALALSAGHQTCHEKPAASSSLSPGHGNSSNAGICQEERSWPPSRLMLALSAGTHVPTAPAARCSMPPGLSGTRREPIQEWLCHRRSGHCGEGRRRKQTNTEAQASFSFAPPWTHGALLPNSTIWDVDALKLCCWSQAGRSGTCEERGCRAATSISLRNTATASWLDSA